MRPVSDAELMAYSVGALDPGRRRELSEHLEADPALKARYTRATRGLSGLSPAPAWRLPPPGRFSFSGLSIAAAESAMSASPLRPGDRFECRISAPEGEPRQVVVLLRSGALWRVVHPQDPGEILPLNALPQTPEGAFVLELVAQSPGRERWAVALAPLGAPIQWSLPEEGRWAWLSVAMEEMQIPAATLEVEVQDPSA